MNNFGQNKATERIEGIELLRKHENLPEDYKMEYECILDDVQFKKLKILKMRYNAEKLQHKSTGISTGDINAMAGEKRIKSKGKKNILKKTKYQNEDEEEDDEEDIDEELEDIDEDDLENLDSDDLEELGEGEEIEEGEDEEEEGEDEEEDIEEGDENNLVSDLDLNEEEDKYEILSEELKSNLSDEDDEQENVHGFVNPDKLLSYKKRYREKIEELRNQQKEKYTHNRKDKAGGKTNKEKLKNKPLMMVLNKKKRESKIKDESINKKIKKMKQQLGRFKRGNMILKKKGAISKKKKAKSH